MRLHVRGTCVLQKLLTAVYWRVSSLLASGACRKDIDLYWLPVHYRSLQAIFQSLQGGQIPVLVTCALQKFPRYILVPAGWI